MFVLLKIVYSQKKQIRKTNPFLRSKYMLEIDTSKVATSFQFKDKNI